MELGANIRLHHTNPHQTKGGVWYRKTCFRGLLINGKGRYRRTEGVYSPVTQNRRHVEAVKAMVRSKFGKLVQVVQHYTLDDYYHSVVVLANEKSLLFADSAPEDVRKQVIRADQLMDYIRALDKRFARKNLRDSFNTTKRGQHKCKKFWGYIMFGKIRLKGIVSL